MKDDELKLTAGEFFEEEGTPLLEAESRVVVPKRGKLIADDNSLKVAIIRPCISRGKRIRGLPPIYTPKMLEKHAAVFTGWPMYEDHLAEQALESFREDLAKDPAMGDLIEFLEERARRIKELGGRVRKSYWNSGIHFSDDEKAGYRPGGVEGEVVVQPRVRAMLESDPEILNVSINAWPTGAKAGIAPWDSSTRGMVIEGIREKPMGSVDWVFRGGAGGRPLLEDLAESDRELAVAVLESFYSPGGSRNEVDRDEIKKLKPEELREWLVENDLGHLAPALREEEPETPPSNGGGLTKADLAEALREQREELSTEFDRKLEERDSDVDERVEEELRERQAATTHERAAHDLIAEAERNGLPSAWAARLRERYTVRASTGVPTSLKVEEEERLQEDGSKKTLTPDEVLEGRVRDDVAEAIELIKATGAPVTVKGFGRSEGVEEGEEDESVTRRSTFRQFLREQDILPPAKKGDKELSESERIAEMVRESA